MGEPYFLSSILPWHNLYFWYARTALATHLADGALVLPCRARLRGVALEFDHLWKCHAPVGDIEGFDVRIFDKLVHVREYTVTEDKIKDDFYLFFNVANLLLERKI